MKVKTIRLLLVDDEADFRSATAEALGRRGFEVTEAESGERALELMRGVLPDAVVLDLKMEGMGGIETLTEIRRQHGPLPVLILTGHGQFDDAVQGIRLSVVDFLQKPVDVARLSARIRQILEAGAPLRERTIAELMVPAAAYRRVRDDAPAREVIQLLRDSLFQRGGEQVAEQAHRTVLVFDRRDRFVGCVRPEQVLELVVPPFLRDSPYASFFTGMFLAQCKVVGGRAVADIVERGRTIDVDAPLMEAVHLLVTERLINLPVIDAGELVGILRDKDLLLEIAGAVLGDLTETDEERADAEHLVPKGKA